MNNLYEITTPDILTQMKISELRKYVKKETEKLLNKSVNNKFVNICIRFKVVSAKKTAYGEAMYYKKASLIPHLPYILENAQYNNFGARKKSDSANLIGYLNFKFKCKINGVAECLRIAVRFEKNGYFYYNIEVNKKP